MSHACKIIIRMNVRPTCRIVFRHIGPEVLFLQIRAYIHFLVIPADLGPCVEVRRRIVLAADVYKFLRPLCIHPRGFVKDPIDGYFVVMEMIRDIPARRGHVTGFGSTCHSFAVIQIAARKDVLVIVMFIENFFKCCESNISDNKYNTKNLFLNYSTDEVKKTYFQAALFAILANYIESVVITIDFKDCRWQKMLIVTLHYCKTYSYNRLQLTIA